MISSKEQLENENIEIDLLIRAIYLKYGYDFTNYIKDHIKRRIIRRQKIDKFDSITKMTEKIIYDLDYFKKIIIDLSINTTEMFRFPEFYLTLRKEVIPYLKTYPSIKIWHAGCSTGEEVYSMAILLKEEELLEKTQIIATDFNNEALKIAKEGIYPLNKVKEWTKNYQLSKGKRFFSDYYSAKYNHIILNKDLMKHITFIEHNLTEVNTFMEANLIVCRNVLIYFNNKLQNQVIQLFLDSLPISGFLGLGSKETIKHKELMKNFDVISSKYKIYKKVY